MENNHIFNNLAYQDRPELLEAIEFVAREKSISIDEVFDAMEKAIKKVANHKYGSLYDIRVSVDRHTGAIMVFRAFTVVEEVENFYHEITVEEAKKKSDTYVLGDLILEALPEVDFARGYVQSFRQIVTSRVREAEKEIEYESYKNKAGEIVSGVVKRVEFGNVFVELSHKAEAFLRRDNTLPRENLEPGMRIRALVKEVKQDAKFSQVRLTRSSIEFIKKLFTQEIQEIYENTIEIKAISRDPGSRSKIALYCEDPSIDAIKTVLGFKGSKIQGILSELKGEKLDLIYYSDSIVNFVINAFYPAEVLKVVVDEENKSLEVVVKDESLSLAIGRRGQNINLVSKLLGWHIDLIGEDAEKEKSQQDLESKIKYYKDTIDVDEVIAQLLIIEGYDTLEDIVNDPEGLFKIEAFSEEIIEELSERAKEYTIQERGNKIQELLSIGVSEELISFLENEGIMLNDISLLVNENVKSLEDLSDLSMYDLVDILSYKKINTERAAEIIIKVRELLA